MADLSYTAQSVSVQSAGAQAPKLLTAKAVSIMRLALKLIGYPFVGR